MLVAGQDCAKDLFEANQVIAEKNKYIGTLELKLAYSTERNLELKAENAELSRDNEVLKKKKKKKNVGITLLSLLSLGLIIG